MATEAGKRVVSAVRRIATMGLVALGLCSCSCRPPPPPPPSPGGTAVEVLAGVKVTVPGVVSRTGTPGELVTVTAKLIGTRELPLAFEPAPGRTTDDFLVYVLVLQPREVGYVATQTARAGASGYQIDLRHFRKAGTSSTAVYALATRGSTRLMVRVDATTAGLSDAEDAQLVAAVLSVLDTAT